VRRTRDLGNTEWVLATRQVRNRRQVGGLAGLTEAWLRFQPRSALARWYQKKFGKGNSRIRKIGIVALARRLLIAFCGISTRMCSRKAPCCAA